MNKTKLLLMTCCLIGISLQAQIKDPVATEVWKPVPQVITPGNATNTAPSDAIVLFDGSHTNEWTHDDGSAVKWQLGDDAMTVVKGTGGIKTKRNFGDCQLHIEWRTPGEVVGKGQGRGNSGIFLQSRYELQVLDNFENVTYSNGQAGSIYKQSIPLVNACRPPGEWQTYDIIYTAPRFNDDGIKTASARITVLHNGVLIQNNTEIKGTTEYIGLPKNSKHGKAPLSLQDHSNPVSYRNIWIREL